MKKEQRDTLILFGIVVVAVIFSASSTQAPLQTVQGDWDVSESVKLQGYEQYLVEEKDFDYSNLAVNQLAQSIKTSSADPYSAVKLTAKHVVDNVKYSSQISVGYCYEETAASVLEKGYGDCVSMSRLVTALLRAQGIPTRTVGGCLSLSQRCSAMFAVIPGLEAKTTPMTGEDFKKRGFLHEWVEAWTPEQGWILVEATSGQIFPTSCASYIQYSYDSNRFNRCVIQDSNFWNQCAQA